MIESCDQFPPTSFRIMSRNYGAVEDGLNDNYNNNNLDLSGVDHAFYYVDNKKKQKKKKREPGECPSCLPICGCWAAFLVVLVGAVFFTIHHYRSSLSGNVLPVTHKVWIPPMTPPTSSTTTSAVSSQSQALPSPSCYRYQACAKLGYTGQCCPNEENETLPCCEL